MKRDTLRSLRGRHRSDPSPNDVLNATPMIILIALIRLLWMVVSSVAIVVGIGLIGALFLPFTWYQIALTVFVVRILFGFVD